MFAVPDVRDLIIRNLGMLGDGSLGIVPILGRTMIVLDPFPRTSLILAPKRFIIRMRSIFLKVLSIAGTVAVEPKSAKVVAIFAILRFLDSPLTIMARLLSRP
jgi:hypothetical protein